MKKHISTSIKLLFTLVLALVLIGTVNADRIEIESNEVKAESGAEGNKDNVSFTKTADKKYYNINDTISYTLYADLSEVTWTNYLDTFTITDVLPEGVELDENSIVVDFTVNGQKDKPIITTNNNAFEVIIDNKNHTLQKRWGITITYEAKVTDYSLAGKTITNVAKLNLEYAENINAALDLNQELEVELTLGILKPEFEITKESDKTDFELGDKIKYSITVKQIEEDAIGQNVIITDEIPEGLTIDEDSIVIEGIEDVEYEIADGKLVITIPAYEYDVELVITYEVTVNEDFEGSEITNTVIIKADNNTEETKSEATVKLLVEEEETPSEEEIPDTYDKIVPLAIATIIALAGIILIILKLKKAQN